MPMARHRQKTRISAPANLRVFCLLRCCPKPRLTQSFGLRLCDLQSLLFLPKQKSIFENIFELGVDIAFVMWYTRNTRTNFLNQFVITTSYFLLTRFVHSSTAGHAGFFQYRKPDKSLHPPALLVRTRTIELGHDKQLTTLLSCPFYVLRAVLPMYLDN